MSPPTTPPRRETSIIDPENQILQEIAPAPAESMSNDPPGTPPRACTSYEKKRNKETKELLSEVQGMLRDEFTNSAEPRGLLDCCKVHFHKNESVKLERQLNQTRDVAHKVLEPLSQVLLQLRASNADIGTARNSRYLSMHALDIDSNITEVKNRVVDYARQRLEALEPDMAPCGSPVHSMGGEPSRKKSVWLRKLTKKIKSPFKPESPVDEFDALIKHQVPLVKAVRRLNQRLHERDLALVSILFSLGPGMDIAYAKTWKYVNQRWKPRESVHPRVDLQFLQRYVEELRALIGSVAE